MIRWMTGVMLVVWLTGCAVIARPIAYRSIKHEPVIDYFYLAPGARVGDRARYVGDHPSMKDSVQVARISGLTDGVFEVVLEPESGMSLILRNTCLSPVRAGSSVPMW